MKRWLASQIWDRGQSDGCARNLANEVRPNETSHRLERGPTEWAASMLSPSAPHPPYIRAKCRQRPAIGRATLPRSDGNVGLASWAQGEPGERAHFARNCPGSMAVEPPRLRLFMTSCGWFSGMTGGWSIDCAPAAGPTLIPQLVWPGQPAVRSRSSQTQAPAQRPWHSLG